MQAGRGYSLAGAGQRTLFDEVIVPADGWYRVTVRAVGIGGDSGMRLRIDNETRHDFSCIDSTPTEESVELLLHAGTRQMTWNIELPRSLQKIKETSEQRIAQGAKARKRKKVAQPLPPDAPKKWPKPHGVMFRFFQHPPRPLNPSTPPSRGSIDRFWECKCASNICV